MSEIGAIVETAVHVDEVETAQGFYERLRVARRQGIEIRLPKPG